MALSQGFAMTQPKPQKHPLVAEWRSGVVTVQVREGQVWGVGQWVLRNARVLCVF